MQQQHQQQKQQDSRNARYRIRYDDDDLDDLDEFDEDMPPEEPDAELPEKRHVLRWVIICVIVLAILAGATFVGLQHPEWIESIVEQGRTLIAGPTPTPEPTPEPTAVPTPTPEPLPDPQAAKIVAFVADTEVQPDLEEGITFTVTTTLQTERVQVVDDNGNVLIEQNTGFTDTADGRVWHLLYYFPSYYEGSVEAYPGNAAGWNEAQGAVILVTAGTAEPTPDPEASGALTAQAGEAVTAVEITGQAFDNTDEVATYARPTAVNMGGVDAYKGAWKGNEGMKGVLTFRGSNMRQNAAFGVVAPEEQKLETVWAATVGSDASGQPTWNTQPLIVQWHKQIREMMALKEGKLTKSSLSEVIFPANDGSIYFFDLEDGMPTRDPLPMEPIMPMLGSVSVYPAGVPVLFFGSGDPSNQTQDAGTGMMVYKLSNNSAVGLLRGDRKEALSKDQTFVTSALVDTAADTMITVGGNGLLYTMTLNTETKSDGEKNEINVVPKVQFYRSSVGEEDTSVQSSLAIHGGTAYFASMGGILQAVNLNTLTTEWAVDVGGETKAAIALEADDAGGLTLYTATTANASGMSTIRRIDAATGEALWSVTVAGSVEASPVVGEKGIENMVIFAAGDGSTLYALDKTSGSTIWQSTLSGNEVSSPLAVYDEQGNAYILQGDTNGMHLLEADGGTDLDVMETDGVPMGSPAAFDNIVVFATDAGKMYGVKIN